MSDRGPNYVECSLCDVATMSSAALAQHARMDHPPCDVFAGGVDDRQWPCVLPFGHGGYHWYADHRSNA